MKGRSFLLATILLSLSLYGKEPDTRLQQISIYVDEIGYQLNHHKVEIDLFHERLKRVEDSLREGLQDFHKIQANQIESGKLKYLEEGQKALLADLKSLKNELIISIAKQAQLEKSVQVQMKEVQASLQKALVLLSGGEESTNTNYYVVKSGDSLSLIAQNLKIPLKALKDANNLSNDYIHVGQKLKLP